MIKHGVTVFLFLCTLTLFAQEDYVRADTSRNNQGFLQTAIRELTPNDSTRPTIFLVGAIHIAEKTYYHQIQDHLNGYERVLFECVAELDQPKIGINTTFDSALKITKKNMETITNCATIYTHKNGYYPHNLDSLRQWYNESQKGFESYQLRNATKNYNHKNLVIEEGLVKDPDGALNPIEIKNKMDSKNKSLLYKDFMEIVDLSFQGEHIDYGRPNFYWCDLSEESLIRISDSEKLNTEDIKATFNMLEGNGIIGSLLSLMIKIIKIMPNAKETFRAVIATVLTNEKKNNESLRKNVSYLILNVRNKHLLETLEKQPKSLKSIGVFYGAAHLVDIENALIQQYHYTPTKTIWIDAFEYDPNLKSPILEGLK